MADQSSREEQIVNAVLQFATREERAACLKVACVGDAALLQRVEALLQAYEHARASIDPDATAKSAPSPNPLLAEPLTEKSGDRIGRYKLLQEIGEGGMGSVWMAEQEVPVRRRVALKVVKLGMDTKQVIARFEAERQALALMDHPNIAKVLDAGATETGRPYFVMELVRGVPITEYCDQNNLSTHQRLELFIPVCKAIQHAHQKGIIHRDIKPSNILVTLHDGVPVPKVIDFGIAKAIDQPLTDKTLFTRFEQFMGTPVYMSPEQAEMSGLDIDTRSDIYALGVLLYELLTSKPPFDPDSLVKSGIEAMRKTIREKEPVRPSTRLATLQGEELTTTAKRRSTDTSKLVHQVKGDLDWIVMKCLEKDRTRRYDSATGVAMDIERCLHDEPVVARPPSAAYRFHKLVRRNKLVFAAAAAVTAALVVGLCVSMWMFFNEKQARQRAVTAEQAQERLRRQAETDERKAQTEAAKSQQVVQFLKDMLKGVGPGVAMGRDTTILREIVDNTVQRIPNDLKDQPAVEIDLRLTLGEMYSDLQLFNKEEETARETLRLARTRFGEKNLAVADALSQLGHALFVLRKLDEAEKVTRQALAMQRELRGPGSLEEARALANLGAILRHQDRKKDSEEALRSALAMYRKQRPVDDDRTAQILYSFSITLYTEEKYVEAESAVREAAGIHQRIHGDGHPYVGTDYGHLCSILLRQGKLEEAETYGRKALELLQSAEGKGKLYQSWAQANLASVLEARGKLVEAESHLREAVAIGRNPLGGEDYPDLVAFLVKLASLLQKEGRLAEARPLAEDAVAICQRNPGRIEGWMRDSAFGLLRNAPANLADTNALEKREPIPTAEPPAK